MFTDDYDVLTVSELMEELQIGQNFAYTLLNNRQIEAYKVGRSWRIPRYAIKKFIKASII